MRPGRAVTSAVLGVGLWLVMPGAARAGSGPGVVVEVVDPGSAAEKAGIVPGDLLMEWTRLPKPPANPQPATGTLRSVFDWLLLEKEQAPRGTVRLSLRRDDRKREVDLLQGPWGMQVRPVLPPERVVEYEQAVSLIQSGEADGVSRLEQLATTLARSSDWPTAGWLSYRAAELCSEQGWWLEAQKAFEEALRVAKGKESPAIESLAWGALGSLFEKQSQYEAATVSFQRALALRDEDDSDTLLAAGWLLGLGRIAFYGGDLPLAETHFARALAMAEKLAPEAMVTARSLNNLGEVARTRGDLARAETWHTRAMAIRERVAPDSLDVAASFNNLGIIASQRGDLAQAESYYSRDLAITEKVAANSLEVAVSFNNLGNVARVRGDLGLAEAWHAKALAIRERLAPDSLDVAMSLNNLGSVAYDRGNLAEAEAWHTKALVIKERLAPGSLDVAFSLDNLGAVAYQRGALAEAEARHTRALAIRERLAPDSLDVSLSLDNLGRVAWSRGDLARAEAWYSRALAINERLAPGSWVEADTLHSLGNLSVRQNKLDQALGFLERAVRALESQRGRWGGASQEAERFSAQFSDTYRDLIEVRRRLGQDEDAFNLLERFRARAFLNMLAERDLDFSRDAPAELLRQQKMTDFAYDQVQQELAEVSERNESERAKTLLARLTVLRRQQNEIALEIKQSSPHLASLHYPEPLDLNGARSVLPADTLFLSYSVGPNATQLFALLNGELTATTIALSRAQLERRVESYVRVLASPALRSNPVSVRQELYNLLLGPVARQVAKAHLLLICPDGPLHLLPFATLSPGADRYIVDEIPVSYVLSATVYGELRRARPYGGGELPILAAFGDPVYATAEGEEPTVRASRGEVSFASLPSTRREVEGICGLYDQSVQKFLGADAREAEAKKLKGARQAVHFACHGFLDERFPLNSGLALTTPEAGAAGVDNGVLQAWEIFETMRLETELVTLSACETGLGEEMGGEGLIGLTRAFQYAGARAVLSTLWSVADETTAVFMKRFYGYLKEGHPKADALRLAQLDFIRSSEAVRQELTTPGITTAHPFYWACFVLNGV